MVETSTGLMKLNQITTKMFIKLISLRCENFVEFVFREFENFSCDHYNGKSWVILDYGLCFKKSLKRLEYFRNLHYACFIMQKM